MRTALLMLGLLAASAPALAGGAGDDKPDLQPDPQWKGTASELLMPSSWVAYFPHAKVGDFVEYSDRGRRRDQVVEVTADGLVVARVVENRNAQGGRMELRWRYKVSETDKKKLAGAKDGKSSSKKPTTPPKKNQSSGSKGKDKEKGKNEPETEVIKVGDRELTCNVTKKGNIITWTNSDVPFDGVVKRKTADDTAQLVDFGRGK
jgi:hypothetical protein